MALNATSWASAIEAAMDGAGMFADLTTPEKTSIYDAWKIVCQGHINHITNNAVINTLVNGSTQSGSPGGPLGILNVPGVGAVT